MTSILLAFVWFIVLGIALAAASFVTRKTRLAHTVGRPETRAPRRKWGGLADRPAGDYGALRALARAARLARSRTDVTFGSRWLARVSRALSLVSTLTALSLLPFAVSAESMLGGSAAVLDLDYGLGLLAVLMLISCVSNTASGLAERATWARLGALRVASESLIAIALFFLLAAPIVLVSNSLRLADVVGSQQLTFSPFAWLAHSVPGLGALGLEVIRLPGWFVFRQPLTALLMVPTLYALTRRPLAYDETGQAVSASGLGFDSDPNETYWAQLDARFSQVLGAALFVGLFLGAGSIPYLNVSSLVEWMTPMVGSLIPGLIALTLEVGAFLAKLLLVLSAVVLVRQATGRARPDQSLRFFTRRLVPLAWANFLLIAAIELLEVSSSGSGAG